MTAATVYMIKMSSEQAGCWKKQAEDQDGDGILTGKLTARKLIVLYYIDQ